MNATQRKNLLKLAAYLETLPRNYRHFNMSWFAEHRGDCKLPMNEEVYAAKRPQAFLNNCGTVACAVGHGPAAGLTVRSDEYLLCSGELAGVIWHKYSSRVFGISGDENSKAFGFLFGGEWDEYDSTHYGAAARIRYFLETGERGGDFHDEEVKKYARYRKGSRSAKRREIEAAL